MCAHASWFFARSTSAHVSVLKVHNEHPQANSETTLENVAVLGECSPTCHDFSFNLFDTLEYEIMSEILRMETISRKGGRRRRDELDRNKKDAIWQRTGPDKYIDGHYGCSTGVRKMMI